MSGRDWTLTVRAGPKVERSQHATLEAATDELAARLEELGKDASRDEIQFFARRIEPEQQVVARLELSGPAGRRGGVDLRGDGSSEAFRGRLRRRVIERRRGESAAHALRRELAT
ncbi:MAG TPA: hypothetical protein VFC22_00150 [Solirubrobacteraceae bacterium]|nr:hypothetical protein [Solirubrobacteraceae bacterium]